MKKLIAAATHVNICDICVDTCIDILVREGAPPSRLTQPEDVDLAKLGLKPRFKTSELKQSKNQCFYLCPFREPYDTIYRDHVMPVATKMGYVVQRVDEVFGIDPIIDDIWRGIVSSAVIIADLTTRNPNVMYEVGVAHTVGRPVIILSQDLDDVPFDLKHYRCLIYEYTPRGMKRLEETIEKTLQFLRPVTQQSA